MKRIVTKVDIVVSDDGGSCDPTCPFLITSDKYFGLAIPGCIAFHKEIVDNKRTIGCMGREDVTYQIPVVEE